MPFVQQPSELQYIRTMTLVYLMVKLRKVSYILRVRFQYIGCLQSSDTILVDIGYLVLKEERVDTLVLVVGSDGDEQKTEGFHLLCFECFEQIIPSEGEQFTAALTQSVRYIRHAETYTHYLVFLIDHERHEIEVQQREIHILVVVLLLDGHRLEVIEFLVCFVYHVHILNAVFAHELA